MLKNVHQAPRQQRPTSGISHRISRRALISIVIGYTSARAARLHAEEPVRTVVEPPTYSEPGAPAVAFPVSPTAPTPQPTDPAIFTYDFASDVPCNLRVKEYWNIINRNRPGAWQQIAQQIQTGSFEALNSSLNFGIAAELRQAALYLPWALLQNSDYTATVDAFKAYKNFDEHVKDLQRAAVAAAAPVPEGTAQAQQQQARQVQQAFILMSASLDGFLATIPARYTAGLAFFGTQEPR